ncbi:hypothetical protein [Microbacterium sp. LWH10-1.2]|uniref:hypothetical protein n=1 Tax=Microbacterium sp. LWH10-1.2 TaxID=3135255 RepID=UPI003138E996
MAAMRCAWAVVAAGLVLVTTGCAAQAAPEGDELYRDGEQRYLAMANTMHTVLMGVHEGVWDVPIGGYGAFPIACDLGLADDGYRFAYRRSVALPDVDGQALSDVAVKAFADAGLEPEAAVYGEGDRAEWNVIAEDDAVGRAVLTIRPAEGTVTASADTPCTPGESDALSAMVGDDENRGDDVLTWRSIPATEGVDSVPQFYFPAGGPVYFNEDESLVEPQPVVTDPPKAPYGS